MVIANLPRSDPVSVPLDGLGIEDADARIGAEWPGLPIPPSCATCGGGADRGDRSHGPAAGLGGYVLVRVPTRSGGGSV